MKRLLIFIFVGTSLWARGVNSEQIPVLDIRSQFVGNPDAELTSIISFEDHNQTNWILTENGRLAYSKDHYKEGKQSLLWYFEKDSPLIAVRPAGLSKTIELDRGGIKGWIYNEHPIDEKLNFSFGSIDEIEHHNPQYKFEFGLNFKGWRAFWIDFKKDAATQNISDMPLEVMAIFPPSDIEKGKIFLDLFEFSDIPWHRTSDYQTPITRAEMDVELGGTTWQRAYFWSKKNPTDALPETITDKEIKAFDTIEKRYYQWLLGLGEDLTTPGVAIRLDAFKEWITIGVEQSKKITINKRDGQVINGDPFFGHNSKRKPRFGKDIAEKVFIQLALDYKLNGNLESKEKLMDLFDHFHDQGWAEGSALGTMDHEGNRLVGWVHAVYLMKDELKKAGKLERELNTMNWFLNFNETFEQEMSTEVTSDDLRTYVQFRLIRILAMENSPKKVQYMKGYLRWVNHTLERQPGYSGGIKPDYTIYHHRHAYYGAYGPQALHNVSSVAWLLSGTIFELNKNSLNNIKQALLTFRSIAQKYDIPKSALLGVCRIYDSRLDFCPFHLLLRWRNAHLAQLNSAFAALHQVKIIKNRLEIYQSDRLLGRFPNNSTRLNRTVPAFAYMALASNHVDKEMAQAFMRLYDLGAKVIKDDLLTRVSSSIMFYHTIGAAILMDKLAAMGFEAEKLDNVHLVKPYANLSTHRRGQWMASVTGWSQYNWDFEASAKENLFGRYDGYGSVQIHSKGNPVNAMDSGYDFNNGWDWNRRPGATTIHLPLKELRHYNNKRTELQPVAMDRNFTDQTFVGGISLENQNGLFSMQLHDPFFSPGFRFNESIFFFDNEIIILGSDISNTNKEHNTETTLFQIALKESSDPIYVNSTVPIKQLPYKDTIDTEGTWLIDPTGNGYVIPNNEITILRQEQISRDDKDKKDTKGNYAVAIIDHGKAPKNRGFEYAILVQSTPQNVKKYSEDPHYTVFQKDANAHILHHKILDITGYAIFNANEPINFGVLKTVSSPVLVMLKDKSDSLILSLSDPDFRREPKQKNMSRMPNATVMAPSQMMKVQVSLEGRYKLRRNFKDIRILSSSPETTVLEFDCVDARIYEIELIKDITAQ